MPIRVSCQCGQSLNVPDQFAGKGVKCPKCQQAVRVPAAGTPSAVAPGATSKGSSGTAAPKTNPTSRAAVKPGTPEAAASDVQPVSSMGNLFDAAGLTQRKGTFCPSCDKTLPPGTTVCVNCGFHIEQGSKIAGFQVENKEFGNRQLVEASEMMKREAETEKRLLNAGFPWWMMFGILVGLLVMIGAMAIKLDASTTGKESSIEAFRRIQSASFVTVLLFSFGLAMASVAVFATLAIIATGFMESWGQGFLCLLLPYIFFYMFSRMRTKKLSSTVTIFLTCGILAAICLGMSLPQI